MKPRHHSIFQLAAIFAILVAITIQQPATPKPPPVNGGSGITIFWDMAKQPNPCRFLALAGANQPSTRFAATGLASCWSSHR